MIRKIFTATALVLCGAGLLVPAASAADPVLPVESNLTIEPSTVTWPSAPSFEYRLNLRSGPEGAEFWLRFPTEPWGPVDLAGTPFSSAEATLEGPGRLLAQPSPAASPSPTACFRGPPGLSGWSYQLTMPPNSESVVRMPSGLTAAPVSGMNRSVSAELGTSHFGFDPIVITAPVTINGPEEVRIVGKIPGSTPFRAREFRPGETFRITGRTVPAAKNRLVSFQAEPRLGGGSLPRSLATVRTGGQGRFRTTPLTLRRSGTWVLTSRVKGAPESSFSCNGAVEVGREIQRATIPTLDGRTFLSTSIKGPGAKPKEIELSFIRGTVYDENFEVVDENGPIMGLDAGCNDMGAGYEARRGWLRWNAPVAGTAMACPDDRSGWISSRLRRGLKATFVGQTLVLKGKRGVRVHLKPRP